MVLMAVLLQRAENEEMGFKTENIPL